MSIGRSLAVPRLPRRPRPPEERPPDELAIVRAEMIRELPREERPRERLLARGCEALSDALPISNPR